MKENKNYNNIDLYFLLGKNEIAIITLLHNRLENHLSSGTVVLRSNMVLFRDYQEVLLNFEHGQWGGVSIRFCLMIHVTEMLFSEPRR